jgi:hypothetical protein
MKINGKGPETKDHDRKEKKNEIVFNFEVYVFV